jgi:hypothetical protein
MTSPSLQSEFRAHLESALASLPEQEREELLRGFDVVAAAIRKECFAVSPITKWLMGDPGNRFTIAEYDEDTKRIRVNLDDVNVEDDPVAIGYGESVEEACADAMNKLMGAAS